MSILFLIPHYFCPTRHPKHGSSSSDREGRATALAACITAIHQFFGARQAALDFSERRVVLANQATACTVHVLVCTTMGRHVLPDLGALSRLFSHHPTEAEPEMLGFECHDLMLKLKDNYDYCCYIEDDIIVHDAWLFQKLAWFNRMIASDALLLPQRYEIDPKGAFHKVYIDGDLRPKVVARFNPPRGDSLSAEFFGRQIAICQPSNPHAGCFFLSREQVDLWASHPASRDRSIDFIGPLESAATYSILRVFRLYKPSLECANFFEVRHFGRRFCSLIGRKTVWAGASDQALQ